MSSNFVSENSQQVEDDTKKKEKPGGESFGSISSRDTIDFDTASMKCFKHIDLSSSSIFEHPLFFFPELEDPGIQQAFTYEPPQQIENDIGRERYLRICKDLEICPLRRILNSLTTDTMDLRYYGLRPKELKALFNVLEINAHVKTVLLQDSWLQEESVNQLSNVLAQNGKISTLSLRECQIGPKGAAALSDGLKMTVTLTDLDLSHNSLGDKGIQSLRMAFKVNESIKKLDLSYNNLDTFSANALNSIFSSHEYIEDVNLEWNNLSKDDAFKKIAAGLRANTNIKRLNLAWNGLETSQIAKELSKYIKGSETLEFLDLSNNRFSNIPAAIVRNAVGVSTSLMSFRFGNNPLSANDATGLGNMLLKSETLKTLDLENIFLPKSYNATLRKIAKAGKTFIYGGILGNYKIIGPNVRQVLLKRCNYLGLKPKKAKAKRDFGPIILTLPTEPIQNDEFQDFIRKKKKAKMYDEDLLKEIKRLFASGKTKVNTLELVSEYMKMYPDTVAPIKKEKPKKKKKGKRKGKKKVTSETDFDKNESPRKEASTTKDEPSTVAESVETSAILVDKPSDSTDNNVADTNLLETNQKLPVGSNENEFDTEKKVTISIENSTISENSTEKSIADQEQSVAPSERYKRKSSVQISDIVQII